MYEVRPSATHLMKVRIIMTSANFPAIFYDTSQRGRDRFSTALSLNFHSAISLVRMRCLTIWVVHPRSCFRLGIKERSVAQGIQCRDEVVSRIRVRLYQPSPSASFMVQLTYAQAVRALSHSLSAYDGELEPEEAISDEEVEPDESPTKKQREGMSQIARPHPSALSNLSATTGMH